MHKQYRYMCVYNCIIQYYLLVEGFIIIVIITIITSIKYKMNVDVGISGEKSNRTRQG